LIACIIGHSGSGKSTVEKILTNQGLKKITLYTTREQRENEIDGVDYHFISEKKFTEMSNEGCFVEESIYGGWMYGLSLSEVDKGVNYILVTTPKGYKKLKEDKKHKLVSFYFYVNENCRRERLLKRGDSSRK